MFPIAKVIRQIRKKNFYFTYNVEEEENFYQEYIDRKRKEFPPDIERRSDVKIKGSRGPETY